MTRFGKSRKTSSKRSLHGGVTRNPPRDILTKSLKNLRDTKSDVQKHTTKELPYLGSAESAAIADLLNEPGEIDSAILAKKIKDSDECLNSLAFVTTVNAYYTDLVANVKKPKDNSNTPLLKKTVQQANNNVVTSFHLDERIPIMVSVGISKILSGIIEDLKKTAETTIDQGTNSNNKGKKIHFISAESVFEYVDKHYGKVINLKSQRVTDQNSNLSMYQVLNKFDADTIENSLKTDHVSGILNGLLRVNEKHVGGTFEYEPSKLQNTNQPFIITTLKDGLDGFVTGCGRVEFIMDSSAADKGHARGIIGGILGCIVTHVMSYAFISALDNIIRVIEDAGKKTSQDIADQVHNAIFHRAMMYPSLIASVDLYDLSENSFDKAIAKEITTVKAVRDVFSNAIKTYDYEASAIAAKTYRHEAPKVPSFLKSPEEILQAQMKMDKMLITRPSNANGPIAVSYTAPGGNNTDALELQKAKALSERVSALHGTWSFGRRRRSSKRRASFGRKRRSMKRRASFGRKRRSSKRRHHAVAEFGKKRRSSKRRASFGRKRRSSKRRHHAVAEFGKRRRRHSVAKFGQMDVENQLTGFGRKRRSSKRRASFGRKRRSHKRRASFGKKRRSSKRRASFGKKRRSSKRRM